jgi:hypothetical protein
MDALVISHEGDTILPVRAADYQGKFVAKILITYALDSHVLASARLFCRLNSITALRPHNGLHLVDNQFAGHPRETHPLVPRQRPSETENVPNCNG